MANQELTFEDFKKLAADNRLSGAEKIGFPQAYREGFSKAILQDICTKLPLAQTRNQLIIDIGCGCDRLTLDLIALCKKNGHTLVLIDSEEMLALIPDQQHIVKIAGKFPFSGNTMKKYLRKADHVLCYSVLFYVFANDNLYNFLHAAADLLKPGGSMLLGDLPNIDKRDRFLASEAGKAFRKNAGKLKGSTAHDNRSQKMDDAVIIAILQRMRRFGCEAYLLPQHASLPMANRREDILIIKR